MALRATGRLLSQRLSRGVFRNFSAQAAESLNNCRQTLLNERRYKAVYDEIRSLKDMAQRDTAYWEPRPPKEARYFNELNIWCLGGILMFGRQIYREKT
ncbi:hypothetical protein MKW94_010671, partial [Papaver nudicaule]|nr:hypothetical protein [Papaver nudicaule]